MSSDNQTGFVLMRQMIFTVIGSIFMVSTVSAAEAERVQGARGDWEIVLTPSSFKNPAGICFIRSVSKIKGGRRNRPEIRIQLNPLSIFLAPDRNLAGVLMALAVIENRTDRAQPRRRLVHEIKIDDGPIVRHIEDPPKHGRWTASRNMANARRFLETMSVGRKLLYRWKLDVAGKTYSYDLAGFSAILKLATSSTGCPSQQKS